MTNRVIQGAERLLQTGAFKKNLDWFPPNASRQSFEASKAFSGTAGQLSWLLQHVHHQAGLQMQVSKEVSDDLLSTDFGDQSEVENVPFPAPTIEFYFEDDALPTILLGRYTAGNIVEHLPQWLEFGQKSQGEHIAAIMRTELTQVSVLIGPTMYKRFLTTGEIETQHDSPLSLDEDESLLFCYMLHLCFKVLIFSSIPFFKPRSRSRKEMTHGGKPGVKGRPERESLHVAYLPHVEYERSKRTPTFKRKSQHNFRGRRGHIRWYNADYYVRMKGSWGYVKPTPDPITGKYPTRTVKVRTVPEGAEMVL